MKFSVTRYGEPLDPSLYTWVSKSKTFTTLEENLVLNFSGIRECTFYTGNNCTFTTSSSCFFHTGSNCVFDTMSNCFFDTVDDCTFDTGLFCTFKTEATSVAIIRSNFSIIDLSDYKKVEFLSDDKIDFDGEIMTYEEYKYLELVKNI